MADILGTADADNLVGTTGDDTINGGLGNDTISADAGNDTVFGNAGDDSILGGEGNDAISGGNGNDTIKGGAGDDLILGDAGNDLLFGGQGNDNLKGGVGSDQLDGGTGDDILNGGKDKDKLIGGTGSDLYLFDGSNDDSRDGDTIAEGANGLDTDKVRFTTFTNLGDVNFFQQGNDLFILYRGTSGSLDNTVKVTGQFAGTGVEQVQLASGKFVSAADINTIIANSIAYAAANGITYNLAAAQNNTDLLAIATGAFHS